MEDFEKRAIRVTRSFSVTLSRMWDMWTNSSHLAKWWGPRGFTSTIHTMDLREGGEWTLTLHAPNGANFPNRSIYLEIMPFSKIVFEHFNPHFITTVFFASGDGYTQIDWTLLFDTPEMRDIIVKAHKADKGQEENLDKLDSYLSQTLLTSEGQVRNNLKFEI